MGSGGVVPLPAFFMEPAGAGATEPSRLSLCVGWDKHWRTTGQSRHPPVFCHPPVPKKAPSPMWVTLFGMETSFNELHSAKAMSPI